MEPGTIVGAKRWPYHGAHPDCWGRPWQGIVLEQDDPRAWAGTLAFPGDELDPDKVKQHVAWCHSEGLLDNSVPVLWTFEGGRLQSHWEKADSLRPYDEDVAEWEESRRRAYQGRQPCST